MITENDFENVKIHWIKMINWAKKQPPDDPAYYWKMEGSIKQDWHGEYCSFCNKSPFGLCLCPINGVTGITCSSKSSQWMKVNAANTWEEWIVEAEKMYKLILEVEEKYFIGRLV